MGTFSERGIYASYLIGELRVDGLDRYDGGETECDEDAATSSRQQLVEDDPRFAELIVQQATGSAEANQLQSVT